MRVARDQPSFPASTIVTFVVRFWRETSAGESHEHCIQDFPPWADTNHVCARPDDTFCEKFDPTARLSEFPSKCVMMSWIAKYPWFLKSDFNKAPQMKIFKHYLSMILGCLLMLSITSCSGAAAAPIPTIVPTPTAPIPPTATASPIQAGDFQRKLTVNGLERTYLLHIPPGLDSSHAVSVVLAFHGFGEQPAEFQQFTGFNEIADKSGFLIVYPEGVGLSWNADVCCGYAFDNKIDEASFVRQIVSDLGTIAQVDPKHIYATGFSMGALLVYKLACEMSDVLAGIAPVAGVLAYGPCQPQQPVSVIQIHGGADIKVPYVGGGELNLPPVEQGVSTWTKLDGCDNSPKAEKLQNIITHTSYSACQAGTAVELYVIEPAGHLWPTKYIWPASQVIWDFFAAHPKP